MLTPEKYNSLKEKVGKHFFNSTHKAKATSKEAMLILAEFLVMCLRWSIEKEKEATKNERRP